MTSRTDNVETLASTPLVAQQPAAHTTSPPASPFERLSFEDQPNVAPAALSSVEISNVAPRSNRFSLSFPVQTSRTGSPIRPSQSPVREAPSVVPESLALLSGPSDTNFLTAIAAQERRVLELKEELAKAEVELNNLKKQWTRHEAQRKRDDAKRGTKLQPIRTSLHATEGEDDIDGSNAWMQQEMERRKALINSNSSSNRTVFSGSRQMRTLSLLSPAGREPSTTGSASSAQPDSARSPQKKLGIADPGTGSQRPATRPIRTAQIPRASSATSNIVPVPVDNTPSELDGAESGLDKEMLLRTSKKMATDLRDGLWTFWEDLRQATVGEEATKIEPFPKRADSLTRNRTSREQNSRASLQESSRDRSTGIVNVSPARALPESLPLGDASFWTEHGAAVDPSATPAKVKKTSPAVRRTKSVSKVSSASDTDGWDAWDEGSPLGSRASSAASEAMTVASTVSDAASPRQSSDMPKLTVWTSNQEQSPPNSSKKDPIPWPALSNLGPKALRRTASHLMAEWERSLTPSPTKDGAGQDDYLGLGAEAAAAAVPSERKKG